MAEIGKLLKIYGITKMDLFLFKIFKKKKNYKIKKWR